MEPARELRGRLARVRRRWVALTVLRTAARAAAWASAPLAAAALVVRAAAPSGWVLVVLAGAAALSALALAVAAVVRMPRRPDDCQVARFVEESTGTTGVTAVACDTLVSAVEVIGAPARHPGGFAQLLVGQAVVVLRAIEPADVVPSAAVGRAAAQAAAALAMFAITAALAAPAALAAGTIVWLAVFPHSIGIQVLTGDARVRAGQPLRIAASLSGRGARLLSLSPALIVTANGEQRSVPMSGSGGSFDYAFDSVDRSFQYRVVAGRAASDLFSVTALIPPRVRSIDVAYEYPRFTGLAPRRDRDSGDVYAPAGTRIRIDVHADKPLAAGELRFSGEPPRALTADAQTATAEMVLTKDAAYRIVLSDRDGLSSVGDTEYFIRVMDDRPPSVHIVRPGADQGITPLEEVAIEARADDDYGIAQFELVYAVGGRPAKTMAFTRVGGTDVARIGSHLLAAEELAVQPGDVISYYARARDVARGKRSSEARSDMFFLEVKPFNEEFVQVQSQSMGGGPQSTQIETLIAAQKEIISATWNLERRSEAGRSVEDVKAVGEAQAELRRRAERMAAAGRRGGRGFFPQQLLPPAQPRARSEGGDAVAAAVAAMGRAMEQLQAARTAGALPHQMAALQELLRAQAEVRRRQVMQQSASAGGGGGTSRTDRDLSALFDGELQRQQRTNYEAPKQSGETDANADADMLERIRALARRQEELARRQRELAASKLDAAEMKRQLERLSREQEELRREAEGIQQGQRAGGGRAGGGGGGPQADAMGRAAEQMRTASRELQRQNAGNAASSGGQAAEALKKIEQQMRGSTADARQRAAGDMQLEAQQIAEAQRRLAAEVARLEKEAAGGTAAGDTARRLAAEKDKLADRVEALERAARDAERNAPGQEGARFRDAASQLQGQQVGARLRSSAQALRGTTADASAPPGSAAPAGQAPRPSGTAREQQLTRALDSVASTLGGGAQGDQRTLADQLQRTGEIRERLNGLEQQVRDAEGRVEAGARAGRSAQGGGELPRLREEYARELQRARDSLGRMQAEQRGGGGSTPEQHEFSRSSPGNEAFKQDFGKWEALRKDVDLALENYEAAASARLGRAGSGDRLSGGGSERVPEPYRPAVSRYFEAIARAKK